MAISGSFSKDNVIRFNDVQVEVSTDGTTWADITTWATNVEFVRGRVNWGETKTLDGSAHVTTGESLGPGTLRVTCLYTEGATDPFENINDAFTANPGLDYDVRFTMNGGTGKEFTSSGGYMIACDLPGADSETTVAGKFSFEIVCDDVADSSA